MRRCVMVVCAVWCAAGASSATQESSFGARLESVRAQAEVPALAGALFSSTGDPVLAVVGVRKRGDATSATVDDLWHIGSITKSFTSLLIAQAVDAGTFGWDDTLGDLLGVARAGGFKNVTLTHLLSHRAGLPADLSLPDRAAIVAGGVTVEVQRQRLVDRVLAGTPASAPGETFAYSNLGYVIAAAVLEAKTGRSWEAQLQADVLLPLALTSAGHGAPGTVGIVSQPRGHRGAAGALTPIEPSLMADNPPFLGPAGRLHMTVGDLARWGQVHLRAARGMDGPISAAIARRLHQPVGGGEYGLGWVIQQPDGRRVVWHNGSNTLWYAIVAFEVEADKGVVLVTNGGIGAAQAIDGAAMSLLK